MKIHKVPQRYLQSYQLPCSHALTVHFGKLLKHLRLRFTAESDSMNQLRLPE